MHVLPHGDPARGQVAAAGAAARFVMVVGGVLVAALVAELPVPRRLRRLDVARIVRERAL